MALNQLSSGKWEIDIGINGRRVRRSSGTHDYKKAKELHDRVANDLWRVAKLGEKPRITVADAGKGHADKCERDKLATAGETRKKVDWIVAALDDLGMGGMLMDQFDRAAIAAVLDHKRKDTRSRIVDGVPVRVPVSGATINRYRSVISCLFDYAKSKGFQAGDAELPDMDKESKGRVRWLTHEEAARLLSELPDYLRAMVEFSLATGLRQHNVAYLEWRDVDTRRAVAWVHPDESKNGEPISIPLNASALRVLAAQKGKHKRLVFPSALGKALVDPGNSAWDSALIRAEIENFRWHDLRHTWATWHVQAGTPLPVLQKLGGWKSYAMVLRYAHFAAGHVAGHAGAVDFDFSLSEAAANEQG